MDAYQQVVNKLQELKITFDLVEHPPALTAEQADSYIEGLKGVRTKSMFLTNKKKTQY
ncbi:prolyl-tRNA synthetase associated domain-containing protein, partial [Streptococcus pneumoniae]|nr:prolyl-tRNA synthetase associated domain-containing protein [Streptococcus pneumoniae]